MAKLALSTVDGLLVIDKPVGLTSHDVVARMRHTLRERRVGHTGTLDPSASGVLPLVIGRATRLARFLSANDKAYEAEIALGASTSTFDSEGEIVGPTYHGEWPSHDDVERVLVEFRGTFVQTPPIFSAKKIAGRRSYRTARAAAKRRVPMATSEAPASVTVSVHALELLDVTARRVRLRLECSAGFYVRSLAHDLGSRLGTGAHLVALRRTRSGELSLADAVPLEIAASDRATAREFVLPTAKMLPELPAVTLSVDGLRRATSGQDVGPGDAEQALAPLLVETMAEQSSTGRIRATYVRLLAPDGDLVALAEPSSAPGFLHPSVVLM